MRVGELEGKFVVPDADISVTALDINPRQVREGEKVTVTAEVTNDGGVTGTHKLELKIDGRTAAEKEVSVLPGETELVTFEVVETKAGEHKVEVGGLEDKFVIPEADIGVTALDINPRQAKEGEEVTVTAGVTNDGGVTGTHKLELKIDGRTAAEKEVSVLPGGAELVTFEVFETKAGEHKVEVGGLEDKFVVPEADIGVTALDINPRQVREGEKVTVIAEVTNDGGVTGTHKLELKIDGRTAAEKEVSVLPGETELVTFEVVETKAGEHKVEVGGLEDKFVIPEADIGVTALDIKIDDRTVADISVLPGETELVTFEVVETKAGEYKVEVGGLEDKFVIPEADIGVTAPDINPRQVREGEKVTVIAEVTNDGGVTGTHKLELKIDGRTAAEKEVSVLPGETELVTFEVFETKAGEHKVEVGGLEDKFVIPEADIGVTALDINPRQVREGEKVTLIAEVTNNSAVTDPYKLELRLGGVFLAAQEFLVAPRVSQRALFYLRNLKPGVYRIAIGNISNTFMVGMENHHRKIPSIR